jgi:hypothetical protein
MGFENRGEYGFSGEMAIFNGLAKLTLADLARAHIGGKRDIAAP